MTREKWTPQVRRRWVNWSLVVAATLSVGAAIATRNTWSSAERMVRGDHLVVGYRDAEIRRVTLSTSGQRLVLERAESQTNPSNGLPSANDDLADLADEGTEPRWQFVEPYQGEADEAAVDALLRAIEFAPFLRKVDEANFDRHAAGLDAPVQSIELEMGEVRTRLHVGANAPVPANARYVEVGGEGTANKGVYVVSESTAKELLVSPDAFRVRQVVPYGATSLERVTLRHGGAQVVLVAGPSGDWRIEVGGKSVRLDRDAVQRLFATLARSRAEHFVSNVTEPAAASVDATFVPKSKDKPALRVRFGGVCPTDSSLELARADVPGAAAACTVPLHLDSFVTQLPELLERRLFSQRLDGVEELALAAGERRLELSRRQEGWTMRTPRAGTVDRDVGDAFVESILDVKGELVPKPEGALSPFATLTVLEAGADDRSERREVVTVFGASAAAGATNEAAAPLFAQRAADDVWLLLSSKQRTLFVPNGLLLESPQLLELDAPHIGSVRIETREWVQAFDNVGKPPECKMSEPAGYRADSALCLDVVDELRVLRAKRWVAENDNGSFGFNQPTLRVAFTTRSPGGEPPAHEHPSADGHDHEQSPQDPETGPGQPPDTVAAERVLLVGGRAADGAYYAQLSPNPAVFTLRASVVDALSALVVDRSAFLFDPQTVQSLVLRAGAREVTLRRLGDQLTGTDVADQATLVDALSMLRPEGAVALVKSGKAEAAPEVYGFQRPILDVKMTRRVDDRMQEDRWVVGRGDVFRDVAIFYVMPVSTQPSAVFVVPRQIVQRVLDAL